MSEPTVNVDGQEFSYGQITMVMRAVKRMTAAKTGDELEAIAALYNTAIHIGLITPAESNVTQIAQGIIELERRNLTVSKPWDIRGGGGQGS